VGQLRELVRRSRCQKATSFTTARATRRWLRQGEPLIVPIWDKTEYPNTRPREQGRQKTKLGACHCPARPLGSRLAVDWYNRSQSLHREDGRRKVTEGRAINSKTTVCVRREELSRRGKTIKGASTPRKGLET